MKILITGGCGFVGSNIAIYLKKKFSKLTIHSLDNLSRRGSFINYNRLKKQNIKNYNYDISNYKRLNKLPKYNFIIDCCAEAAVEVSKSDTDRVFSTNLIGTFNLLKKCAKDNSNLIFLSSSRVYSIKLLRKLSKKIKKNKKKINVVIKKSKNQSCSIFGSCLITNIKNQESPKWLKDRLIAVGLRPISAVVDITNFIMLDLNRPLHAYDLDKINKKIIVRESKKNEVINALDNKKYNLSDGMCVIADENSPLGLGGIIGGISSSTEIETKNIFLESAYFDPSITRETSNILNINTDAKYRFERGIDPESIEIGLLKAAEMITEICGGEVGKVKIIKTKKLNKKQIQIENNFTSKVLGIDIKTKEITKILESLGFKCKINKNNILVQIPSWRPDINGKIDLVEEIIRIKGLEKIQSIEPEKKRINQTLNNQQKHFHLAQRSIAAKGYLEAITWSFTNENTNNYFLNSKKTSKLINPISSDLGVLRSSIFSNLVEKVRENIDRGENNISLFEVGPVFKGINPGDQATMATAISAGYALNPNWNEKGRILDVFDAKRDLLHVLNDLGTIEDQITIETNNLPNYFHPGKSGKVSFSNNLNNPFASFGELHPNIINKLGIKTNSLVGFEINLENYVKLKENNNKYKITYEFSEYQKSERDFAFIVDKSIQAQELFKIIKKTTNQKESNNHHQERAAVSFHFNTASHRFAFL